MAWVRIDDGMTEHPKLVEAGPLALALHVAGLCYCNRQLTDGLIPRKVARRLMDFEDYDDVDSVIERLVAAEIWHLEGSDYRIHDYLEYQPSRADVEHKRDLNRQRQQRFRDRQAASSDDNAVTNAPVTPLRTRDSRVSHSASNAPPNPTQSQEEDTLTGGGDAAVSHALVTPLRETGTEQDRAIFQAFMDVFYPHIPHQKLTKSARGELNNAVKELMEIGVTAAEIPAKVEAYRARWPDIECTPSAIAKHWQRMDQERPGRRLSKAEREVIEHMERTRPGTDWTE